MYVYQYIGNDSYPSGDRGKLYADIFVLRSDQPDRRAARRIGIVYGIFRYDIGKYRYKTTRYINDNTLYFTAL